MTNQQVPEALWLADTLQAVEEGWSIADKCCTELRRLHYENERLAAMVDAQQPAPSAAAAPDETTAMNRTRELAESGRWPSDWVEAYRRGYSDRAANAPADSQPAPEYVGNGMFKGETIQKAAEHWANWCDVRCMTGLSEFLRVVASRAPADSVLEDAGGANWQDISTAPKDGTQFVAVGNDYGLDSETQHTCIAQWFRGCWMEVSEWNEASELKYLTHWMPLPPLPGSAARKKGGA